MIKGLDEIKEIKDKIIAKISFAESKNFMNVSSILLIKA